MPSRKSKKRGISKSKSKLTSISAAESRSFPKIRIQGWEAKMAKEYEESKHLKARKYKSGLEILVGSITLLSVAIGVYSFLPDILSLSAKWEIFERFIQLVTIVYLSFSLSQKFFFKARTGEKEK